MKKLKLYRMPETDHGTCGRIETAESEQLCVTLEHRNRGNQRMVSRIPAGKYLGFIRLSPKRRYRLPELYRVPGRSNIQIHIGNTTVDTDGCILVGSAFGKVLVAGKLVPGVVQSRAAFKRLMDYLHGSTEFELEIVDA